MTSIAIGFSTATMFTGAGMSAPLSFYGLYPPDLGCIGIGISGTSEPTVVVARVTDAARALLMRSLTDGTSIRVTKFAFGSAGYDVADPIRALLVDTTATGLIQETYRKAVDVYEFPTTDGRTVSFGARLSRLELVGGIGEFALIAEILSSPFPAEIGTTLIFAIGHQGLRSKSTNHVETYRILIVI